MPPGDVCVPGVSRAIIAALKLRMRGAVEFDLTGVSCAIDAIEGDVLIATPAPGARVGVPMRFAIARPVADRQGESVHVGEAVATVHAVGAAVRATHDLERGAVIAASDVEQADAPLDGVPLLHTLTVADVVGASVRVPLRHGEIVNRTSIVPVPVIRSGDRVRAILRVDGVEVETMAVAAESGGLDQVIRVVNPGSRRAIRARVQAPGQVEVSDVR
ncbi:MAG TPA: flagellar basal body P-ring formation chaperone FlgA [Vicinamibacterales bacterium]|nr:flagellar basal body P-ring formation chaperone FlgA [Vicinamibacterales bacterium]